MTFYTDVALCYCVRLTGAPCWQFLEGELSDSGQY
jgi:hypothetical protein